MDYPKGGPIGLPLVVACNCLASLTGVTQTVLPGHNKGRQCNACCLVPDLNRSLSPLV